MTISVSHATFATFPDDVIGRKRRSQRTRQVHDAALERGSCTTRCCPDEDDHDAYSTDSNRYSAVKRLVEPWILIAHLMPLMPQQGTTSPCMIHPCQWSTTLMDGLTDSSSKLSPCLLQRKSTAPHAPAGSSGPPSSGFANGMMRLASHPHGHQHHSAVPRRRSAFILYPCG